MTRSEFELIKKRNTKLRAVNPIVKPKPVGETNTEYRDLVRLAGFDSIESFRQYMLSKARPNEYGAVCYTEKRNGFELNYSDNCKSIFGIGGNNRGIFSDIRFN